MNPSASVLEMRNVSHSYSLGSPRAVPSLKNVSLQVHAGQVVGLIGASGSGKSTLLQHLNGLIRPQQGDVIVLGQSLRQAAVDIRAIRRQIGLVFQNPEDQLFETYAGDDVAFGPRCLGWPPEQVRARVRAAMEDVGLPFAFKDQLTLSLSHGQRRRLAIAGVLAVDPVALVLDEPSSGLDPAAHRDLLELLKRWQSTHNRAMVIASHSMDDIAVLADQVVVLNQGTVLFQGTPGEVYAQQPLLSSVGLGVPAATQILLELRRHGLSAAQPGLTVEQVADQIEAWFHEPH